MRTPAKIALTHERLTVVKGDVFDGAGLTAAVVAAAPDAVISTFGQVPPRRKDLMRASIPNIAAASVAANARLVFLAGSIWHVDGDEPTPFMARFTAVLQCCLCTNAWGAGGDFSVGLASLHDFPALDWTAVRPPNISGGAGKAGSPQDLVIGPVSTCRGDIRRVDLARFMVSSALLAKGGPWRQQSPTVSNK